jgi:hypothetical protein
MKSGQGSLKGGAFERLLCRRLSLWLSQGERSDLLWRSAMSGGRATLQLAKDEVNRAQSGDLTAIASAAYQFCDRTFIEAKHYRDLAIARGLLCDTGLLAKFWKTTVAAAARYDKIPLLIARQNRYPIIAVTGDAAVFACPPVLTLHGWSAQLYLLDAALEAPPVLAFREPLVRLSRPRK